MNQQYEYIPPPPPPTPGVNAPNGAFPLERQRPPIATNIVRTLGGSSQTPATATGYGPGTPFSISPNTPSHFHSRSPGSLAPPPSTVSPRTAGMEPYDPRQWNRRQVSGSQMVFQSRSSSTREATGMEGTFCIPIEHKALLIELC